MVIHPLQDCVSNRAGRAGLCTCLDRYLYNIMSSLEFDSNVAQAKPTQHPCKLSNCIWWPSFTKTSRAGHETSSGKMIIRSYVYILIYNIKVILCIFLPARRNGASMVPTYNKQESSAKSALEDSFHIENIPAPGLGTLFGPDGRPLPLVGSKSNKSSR